MDQKRENQSERKFFVQKKYKNKLPLCSPFVKVVLQLSEKDMSVWHSCRPSFRYSPNTIAAGGNVLIPSSPCGVTFDLIEYLFARVLSRSPLPNCQVIFISETADTCFAFGNICGEWLCDSKKCRVFQPQEPFVHGSLVRGGRVKLMKSISECEKHDLRSPYIVFASHPSLRVGDAVQFLLLMKDNEKNTIILTDPEFSPNEVLFPYKPISMKVAFCPIDVRMNTVEAVSLLSSLQPKALCLPIQEKITVENFCNTSEIVNTRYYSTSNICPIPPDHRLVKIKLDPKLASAVTLFDLGCGKSIGRVAGRLILKEIGYYVERQHVHHEQAVLMQAKRDISLPDLRKKN
ncbi:Integrator complex subunit 9 -like protein [Trichinella sp. T9]|nr:Integrator complex subunit 9 -like protein [Trichinella sp. T9]